jgi:D-sedoheptulose 7-phosphate isomerase
MENLIRQRIEESISVHREILRLTPVLAEVAAVLVSAYKAGKKAIFFGNGGSAADAQHLAAEMVGKYLLDRRPIPALALTVNSSAVTAIGNDYGYELVFARQLQGLGNPGDVAIGISTSGNSANVVAGLKAAKEMGMHTIALTGEGGGKMKEVADHCIAIPSKVTPRIQEGHILVGHTLCELVERALFDPTYASA